MGHNIVIKCPNGRTATTRISINWSSFSDIFHIGDICGHSGKNGVIKKLKEAIATLNGLGIISENEIKVDGYGNLPHGIILSNYELYLHRRSMFTSILMNFLQIAENNPEGYWYSDQAGIAKKLYDHIGIRQCDLDFPDEPAPNGPVTNYRHPIKGNMKIDSYATAMEIHLLTLKDGDHNRANMWYDLAHQMPDCPRKK